MNRYIGSTAQLAERLMELSRLSRKDSLEAVNSRETRFYEGKASAFEIAANMVASLEIKDVPELIWQALPPQNHV